MEAEASSKGAHRGESELSILGLSIVRGRDSQLFNHETSQNLEFQLNSFRDMLMKEVGAREALESRLERALAGEASRAGISLDVSVERAKTLKFFRQYLSRRMCFRWQNRAGMIAFRKWFMEWRSSCLHDVHAQCEILSGREGQGEDAPGGRSSAEGREAQAAACWSSVDEMCSTEPLPLASVSTQTWDVRMDEGDEDSFEAQGTVSRRGEGFSNRFHDPDLQDSECQTVDREVVDAEAQTPQSLDSNLSETVTRHLQHESSQTEAVNVADELHVMHRERQTNTQGTHVEIQTVRNHNDEMTTQTETSDLVDMSAQTALVNITDQSAQTTTVLNNAIHTQTIAVEHADEDQIDVARGPLPPPREVSETFAPVALGASSPSLSGDLDLSLRSKRDDISPIARSSETNLLFDEAERSVTWCVERLQELRREHHEDAHVIQEIEHVFLHLLPVAKLTAEAGEADKQHALAEPQKLNEFLHEDESRGESAASNYSTVRREDDDDKFQAKDVEVDSSSSDEDVESGGEVESGDEKSEMKKMVQRVRDLEDELMSSKQELEMERKKNAGVVRVRDNDDDESDREDIGQDLVKKLQLDIEEMNVKLIAMAEKNRSLSSQVERLAELLQESNSDYEELLQEHEKDLHKSSIALNAALTAAQHVGNMKAEAMMQELVILRREKEMKEILSGQENNAEAMEELEEREARREERRNRPGGEALDAHMMSSMKDEIEKLLARRANDLQAIDELLQRQAANQLQEDQLREENRQLKEEMKRLREEPSQLRDQETLQTVQDLQQEIEREKDIHSNLSKQNAEIAHRLQVALNKQKQLQSDKDKAAEEEAKLAAELAGALCEARGLREELEVLRRNSLHHQQQQQQQQQHEQHLMAGDVDLDDTEAILQRGDAEELEMQLRLAVSEIMRRRAEGGGRSPGPAKEEAERGHAGTFMDNWESRRFSGALDEIEEQLASLEGQILLSLRGEVEGVKEQVRQNRHAMEKKVQELLLENSLCRSHARQLEQSLTSPHEGRGAAGSGHADCSRCARTREEAEYVKEANAKNIEMLTEMLNDTQNELEKWRTAALPGNDKIRKKLLAESGL
uniref:Uncharacterized protein n=1 Tax=Guillardia theta TaxID=55529 RepID=A0A7S4NT57_GUITH